MQVFDKQFFLDLFPVCNKHRYYAHLPKDEQKGRSPELLSEHSLLVAEYAQALAKAHRLNSIIEKLIENTIPSNLGNKELLAETIEKLFWRAFAFHDLGKVNQNFQSDKMKNQIDEMLKVKHSFKDQHSIISVYLFLALSYQDLLLLPFSDEEQIFAYNLALYLSYPIYKHHSSTIEKAQDENNWCNEKLFELAPYLTLFNHHLTDSQLGEFHSNFLKNADFNFFFKHFNHSIGFIPDKNAFPLFMLTKLNYSLLTAADYLATAHYMNGWQEALSDFGILNEGLKAKIISNAKTSKSYNREVHEAIIAGKAENPNDYRLQNNENLNALRRCLATEVISNIKKNNHKHLFYIEAPTGSGKTNVSMLALAEMLKSDSSIQKVFYVFPFTTLITQTYRSLAETLGLEDSEMAEVHSKAPLSTQNNEKSDYLNYLDHLFMNYPVALLSHIRFFEVLKTNEKETNYLLHRMAHSIVIIDEIQSYPPKIWDKIVYFIANYAKYFHMKFIIMSATLPKIGDIIDKKEWASDFVYLMEEKNKYFQNPNFCNRVQFDYSWLDQHKPAKGEISGYLKNLCNEVFKQSIAYAEANTLYPDSVFTIVEFIFKKTASEFYAMVGCENEFFDEILLLSGTILEPRRKQIIDKLKAEDTRKKKILLITTQVVEAGVDIDMDLGFKDISIIDSEEQLAGRINRNVRKPVCRLYLFDCDTEKTLYGKDDRYRLMREMRDKYEQILREKDFDKLYTSVIKEIIKRNGSKYTENIDNLFKGIATLNFNEVNKSFKIIDQQSRSVFVPLEIAVSLIPRYINTLNDLSIPYSVVVSGADVWKKYIKIITTESESFIKKKINLKKLQSIMSVFTFSIFPNGKDYELLKTYGREEYGFLYLETFNEVYSFDDGVLTKNLQESNFI